MRKKVTLQYIAKGATRKACYKKRKKGLLKKVNELSTLCGVDACAIITSEYDRQPEVWPSKEGVDQVINRFSNLSKMEQTRKMVNQETFIKERIKKLKERLTKLESENKHKEMTLIMKDCLSERMSVQNLDLAKLHDLGSIVKQNLMAITMRIRNLEKESGGSSLVPVYAPLHQTVPMEAISTSELVVSPIPANQQNNTNHMQISSVAPLQGMPMAYVRSFQGLPMFSPDEAMAMAQMMHGFQNSPLPPLMSSPQMHNFHHQVASMATPIPPMSAYQMQSFQHPMAVPSALPFPNSIQPWSPLACQAFEDLMIPPFIPNDAAAGPSNTQ